MRRNGAVCGAARRGVGVFAVRVKDVVRRRVAEHAEGLVALSEALHADPETAWEEQRAAARVPELLAAAGFEVTPRYLGLDTGFLASAGDGPVRIALCAEYDALPGLGHACGTT